LICWSIPTIIDGASWWWQRELMFTLFAVPKPFAGHVGVIQHNALGAWSRLGSDCEVVLFGDEAGIADAARQHGARHVPEVARNEWGTPLVSDVFAQAMQLASRPILVYANADMILTGDLPRALARVRHWPRFLLCGRRWNLDVVEPLRFDIGWEDRLRAAVAQRGDLAIPGAIDYFAFPRTLYGALPPFAVGRVEWDQWLLFQARAAGAPLIDATDCVLAVHQNHDYAHLTAAPRAEVQREIDRNRALAAFHRLDLRDATHLLTATRLRPALDRQHLMRRAVSLAKYYLPATASVLALYAFWRRRVRGLDPLGGLGP
jgi:hypothetical protein